MANIKGILFDKDGTLIEFTELWTAIANGLVSELAGPGNVILKEKLLVSIGLVKNEVIPKGILSSGTTKDIEMAFRQVLIEEKAPFPEPLHHWIEEKIFRLTKNNLNVIKPVTDLKVLLNRLKEQGLKIGVATADDKETTLLTFNLLGISHYFDFIGTSDRYRKKPHPDMMEAFCQEVHVLAEEVVMVGDTPVDIAFARNAKCQLMIGVHSGAGEEQDLLEADFRIPSVAHIIDTNNNFIWEKAVSG